MTSSRLAHRRNNARRPPICKKPPRPPPPDHPVLIAAHITYWLAAGGALLQYDYDVLLILDPTHGPTYYTATWDDGGRHHVLYAIYDPATPTADAQLEIWQPPAAHYISHWSALPATSPPWSFAADDTWHILFPKNSHLAGHTI